MTYFTWCDNWGCRMYHYMNSIREVVRSSVIFICSFAVDDCLAYCLYCDLYCVCLHRRSLSYWWRVVKIRRRGSWFRFHSIHFTLLSSPSSMPTLWVVLKLFRCKLFASYKTTIHPASWKLFYMTYSFILDISIAPPQVHYNSEALRLQHWYCVGVNTAKRYRQLRVKDLPEAPTWCL